MKLVIGLGNPEAKYNFTRHNTGFLALDFYFKLNHLTWKPKPRLGAIYGRGEDIIFIKPQDYYNNSGQAVREYTRFYKIPPGDILVICDDFNLDFGIIRYRSGGSSGGNNGLKSIITELGTDAFPRLRLGTGNAKIHSKLGDVDFVLSKFTPEEKQSLPSILKDTASRIDDFITNN